MTGRPMEVQVMTRDSEIIADLQAQIAARDLIIARQAAEIEHGRKIFDEASVAARLGVWECDLADERLMWSDGVYDIFGLPAGSALKRDQIVALYTPQSRKQMQRLRAEAVRNRSGFTYEAEIRTVQGKRKWMRITAKVECENGRPIRIFGIKQDITEERLLLDRTRHLAEFDTLTGLANRGHFQTHLGEIDRLPPAEARYSALVLVDLDHFKQINDTFGHSTGDQCLVETARRLKVHCAEAAIIARIGGDEFAILLREGLDEAAIRAAGGRILAAFGAIERIAGNPIRLGVSVGIAAIDGQTSHHLFLEADAALYAAKDSGRQALRVYSKDIAHRFKGPPAAA